MTKIFDIVHLNGYMYAVDKPLRTFVQNDWIIEKEIYVSKYPSYMTDLNECSIIISTTNSSLGLPLLPVIEDIVPNLHTTDEDHQWAFKEGYKTASAKKYTEEDLRNAWKLGYKFLETGEGNLDAYIESLNPKPIQVEIEMHCLCNIKRGSCDCSEQDIDCQSESLQPVVFHEGHVKVKKWIYENDKT